MLRNVNASGMSASPGENEGAAAPAHILRRQHSLHHVLIRPVCAHGDEHRPDQTGKDRVLRLEHAFPFVPAMPGRIETGGEEIRNLEWAVALHDFVPAAWNGGVEQAKRD